MAANQEGRILSLHVCVGHFEPMKDTDTVNVLTGFGIEGDRHASEHPARRRRQVLLMDKETLDHFGLEQGQIRENITTAGIDLASLPRGQQLSLGDDVLLEITGDCEPCAFIEGIRDGLRSEIEGRRGMLAYVTTGGSLKVGDPVKPV